MKKFTTHLADTQATALVPIAPENFNFEKYGQYSADVNPKCVAFRQLDSGVVVYRCGPVAGYFSVGCSVMKPAYLVCRLIRKTLVHDRENIKIEEK